MTRFALVLFFTTLPATLLAPLMGSLVDRMDRRKLMILGDLVAGSSTFVIFALTWNDQLAIWHIYVLLAAAAAGNTLQLLAFTASTSLMVPNRHLGRASGLNNTASAAAEITAPLLAGFLMSSVALEWIIMIDLVTFGIAILTLLIVRIPNPERSPGSEGEEEKEPSGQGAGASWTYLKQNAGLRNLMFMMALVNFTRGAVIVLITPLVLGFASVEVLGVVLGGAGFGFLAGAILMGVWGGPRRRVNGVYGGLALYATALCLASVTTSSGAIVAVAFLVMVPAPILNGCSLAIWQSKVTPSLQGRVFAFRRMITFAAVSFAQLVSGPLTDYVFEPLLVQEGPLAGSVGQVIGVGPGRGIGFLIALLGLSMYLTLTWVYRYPRIRRIEYEMPDVIPTET